MWPMTSIRHNKEWKQWKIHQALVWLSEINTEFCLKSKQICEGGDEMFGKCCPLVVHTAHYTLWWSVLKITHCQETLHSSQYVQSRALGRRHHLIWPFTWRPCASEGHDAVWQEAKPTSFSEPLWSDFVPSHLFIVCSKRLHERWVTWSVIWCHAKDKQTNSIYSNMSNAYKGVKTFPVSMSLKENGLNAEARKQNHNTGDGEHLTMSKFFFRWRLKAWLEN